MPHKDEYVRDGKTISEYNKKYYQTHRGKLLERANRRTVVNPSYNKAYYASHKEQVRVQNKKYYKEHKKEVTMRQITRELKIIGKRTKLVKARMEYHSFMRVRELRDINSSYGLTATMLRLEANLVGAGNSLNKVLKDGAVA